MQPLFFVSHPAALCAHKPGISDNITEFIKFFGNIFFFPFAKLFCLFCHVLLLYCTRASRILLMKPSDACKIRAQYHINLTMKIMFVNVKYRHFFSLEEIEMQRWAATILYRDF